MRKWAEDDLPDQKMLLKGANSLSNAELLAIIIGTGIKDNSSLEIAKQMLESSDNNLNAFWRMNYSDLKKFTGIGEKRAVKMLAIFALARRRNESESLSQQKVSSSRDAFEIFHSLMGDLPYEEFWILLLSKANGILKKVRISEGGVSGTVVDPKKIYKIAIDHHASSVLSWDIIILQGTSSLVKLIIKSPRRLRNAGFYWILLSWIILSLVMTGYYSFADEGGL